MSTHLKKLLPVITLVILALVTLALKNCNAGNHSSPRNNTVQTNETAPVKQRGLNRNPSHIKYSKHAKCRMGCRHIDESEVLELLKDGQVNYRKSDLNAEDCRKKYAVEGYSHDNQHLRIIFAPCQDELTVVTVIDLGTEWPCDCDPRGNQE